MSTEVGPRRVRDAIESATTTSAISQCVLGALIAAVATSRAAHHTLAAPALVGLIAGWAFTLACLGWPQGFYAGAAQVLGGEVALDGTRVAEGDWSPARAARQAEERSRRVDGFATRGLWGTGVEVACVATAWAVLGAGMVAAVLDGRPATWIVVAACLAGLSGTAAVFVDSAARRHGMAAAQALQWGDAPVGEPAGLRRRAWRQIGVPAALLQAGVNGAGTWILFHSYSRAGGVASGPVLTSHVALADAVVTVVILGVLFSGLGTGWGRVDALLGKVAVGDAGEGVAPSAPLGAQAAVYVGVGGLLVAKLLQVVLPKAPSLLEVGVARAVLGGGVALAFTAIGYVRGACNGEVSRTSEAVVLQRVSAVAQ